MATAEIKEADDEIDEHTKPPFLRRVRIRGYKSIAFCDVTLEPLTILVGRNGSGKSNFLEALAFLRDAVVSGTMNAVHVHRGRHEILCRLECNDTVSFHAEMALAQPDTASPCAVDYQLQIAIPQGTMPEVRYERASFDNGEPNSAFGFERRESTVRWFGLSNGKPRPDRAHARQRTVIEAIDDSPFADAYLGTLASGFYNFSPEAIRTLHEPTPGLMLEKNGWNLASVIEDLRARDQNSFNRIKAYLSAIVDDVQDFTPVSTRQYLTLNFRMRPGSTDFDASSTSDGTLRALASLVAVAQTHLPFGSGAIGIEEPETALHPAAMRVLVDALRDATQHTQVLITTHSPDLLDDRHIDPRQVLVVRNRNGQTQIAPVGPAGKEIVQKELYSLADLQRMDHLDPDEEDLMRQAAETNGKQEK